MVVKSLKCLFILFPCTMLHDRMITWYIMLTWYRTPALICYTWHQHLTCYYLRDTWYLTLVFDILYLTPDLDTWYMTPVLDLLLLDTWYLIHDIWHWYLTCYHLTPDTWDLILWHLMVDMLSPGTSTLDLILWNLIRYYCTWHLYYFTYSWLSLLRGLGMIIILLPDIWYS